MCSIAVQFQYSSIQYAAGIVGVYDSLARSHTHDWLPASIHQYCTAAVLVLTKKIGNRERSSFCLVQFKFRIACLNTSTLYCTCTGWTRCTKTHQPDQKFRNHIKFFFRSKCSWNSGGCTPADSKVPKLSPREVSVEVGDTQWKWEIENFMKKN